MKKIVGFLLVFTMLISIGTSAYAQNNEYKEYGYENKGELINFLKENGVSKEEQKILIEKIENNQMWDVCDEKKRKEIPNDFYVIDPKDGDIERYYRFPDGSFIKISCTQNDAIEIDGSEKNNKLLKEKIKDEELYQKIISKNPNKMMNSEDLEVSVNTIMTGTGYAWYYDHRIELQIGVMSAEMITEFVLVDGADDYLIPSGFFGAEVSEFGTLEMDPVISIIREEEESDTSRWALADMHWFSSITLPTPWGGVTGSGVKHLYLGVGDNSYEVSDSLPY